MQACEADSTALFRCEAVNGRRFIELCAPSPLDAQTGYLLYRFGSLERFHAATYTHGGVYTQSVRFASGGFGYTVFTRARGSEVLDAGVEVRDRRSGKTSIVSCSEIPRFYIYDLKGLVPCDAETPVGRACVE